MRQPLTAAVWHAAFESRGRMIVGVIVYVTLEQHPRTREWSMRILSSSTHWCPVAMLDALFRPTHQLAICLDDVLVSQLVGSAIAPVRGIMERRPSPIAVATIGQLMLDAGLAGFPLVRVHGSEARSWPGRWLTRLFLRLLHWTPLGVTAFNSAGAWLRHQRGRSLLLAPGAASLMLSRSQAHAELHSRTRTVSRLLEQATGAQQGMRWSTVYQATDTNETIYDLTPAEAAAAGRWWSAQVQVEDKARALAALVHLMQHGKLGLNELNDPEGRCHSPHRHRGGRWTYLLDTRHWLDLEKTS